MKMPLIAPKPFKQFTPDEYHTYVTAMYGLREKRTATKPTAGVIGLSISRTKKGALSLRCSKARTFRYITFPEIARLADFIKCSQADIWNLCKRQKYIVAKDRMAAEHIYAQAKNIKLKETT